MIRLREARVLLRAKCYDGAYYLAGYAVECALKACIARHTKRFEFPDKVRTQQSYTHRIGSLVEPAKLEIELAGKLAVASSFKKNWDQVTEWSEQSRYRRNTRDDAERLVEAVEHPVHGVMTWLKQHY